MSEPYQPPSGFLFAGISAGIKKKGGKDLGLILAENDCSAAGVFTTSLLQAAPVLISRQRIKSGKARAILVNSGNANCGLGQDGIIGAKETSRGLADHLDIKDSSILLASTGVIGEPFPSRKIIRAIPELVSKAGRNRGRDFMRAIMTTDTREKIAAASLTIKGKEVRLMGFAKGAGMIQPKMATMLAFVLTDAQVKPVHLQRVLKESMEGSFNRVTIDGDTSTNDTLFALASGAGGVEAEPNKPGWKRFTDAFRRVCLELAGKIAADGEGASRWFYVKVEGARTGADAEKIARRIANSPLVKTAVSAADPNWGRIVAAAGISGARFDIKKSSLYLIGAKDGKRLEIFRHGARSRTYRGRESERKASEILKQSGFTILFKAGNAAAGFQIISCDFTEAYVRINAEYRS